MSRPSPAMVVALVALFVALGGVAVANTGGNFILGQSNTANQTTELSSNVASGPSLLVENSGGKPAARFNSSSGPPLAVGNSNKVQNLNADRLDGIDSTGLVRGGGTISRARMSIQPGTIKPFFQLSDLASFAVQCISAGQAYGLVANQSSSTLDVYTSTGHFSLGQNNGNNIGSWDGVRLVQVGQTRFNGGLLGVDHVATIALALQPGDPCRAQAQAMLQP